MSCASRKGVRNWVAASLVAGLAVLAAASIGPGSALAQTGWDKVVAEAKKEGKVVVYNGTNFKIVRKLGDLFQKQYGIAVEVLDGRATEVRERIRTEQANAEAGKPSGIRIKVNSMVDEAVIDALYRASQAGVPIDIWVRGICSLRPGVEGLSETIRVRSILGRYLEHSRIFIFENDGDPQVYIGSADMMHRNLDRRVEALVRVVNPAHVKELLDLFSLAMADTTSSWWLGPEGEWTRHSLDAEGKPLIDLQDKTMTNVQRRRRARAVR